MLLSAYQNLKFNLDIWCNEIMRVREFTLGAVSCCFCRSGKGHSVEMKSSGSNPAIVERYTWTYTICKSNRTNLLAFRQFVWRTLFVLFILIRDLCDGHQLDAVRVYVFAINSIAFIASVGRIFDLVKHSIPKPSL